MGNLIEMTEQEYISSVVEYPTIVYMKENDLIRWAAPIGYNILDSHDSVFLCSDVDFLVKI